MDIQATINYTSVDANANDSANAIGRHIPFIGNADDMHAKPVSVSIRNARPLMEMNELRLEKEGFIMVDQNTDLTAGDLFCAGSSKESFTRIVRYYDEMKRLIKKHTGAPYVHVFGHQARDKSKADEIGLLNPFADQDGVSGYADVVHTDFCSKKALQKLLDGVGLINMSTDAGEASFDFTPPTSLEIASLLGGRYMLINCWRNISDKHPILNDHLACCSAKSVDIHSDMVRCDVPLKKKTLDLGATSLEVDVPAAEQYRLIETSASKHQWYYFPDMVKDEVLMFKQFDSDVAAPARFCFHTSFSSSLDTTLPQRQSVEVRAIAFFPESHQTQIGDLTRGMQTLRTPCECAQEVEGDLRDCNVAELSLCTCGCASPKAIPVASTLKVDCGCPNSSNPYHTCVSACGCKCFQKTDCGCPNASNPYHTCVDACGCTCNAVANVDEYVVPQWLEDLYAAEDTFLGSKATQLLMNSFRNSSASQSKHWLDLLSDQVVLSHSSTTCGKMRKVCSKEAAVSAAASSASSPFARCTYLKRYSSCLDNASCGIVEGEFTYDHKLSRDRLVLPFTAHVVFDPQSKAIVRRHTFCDGAALEQFCADLGALWQPLEMSLYSGASHGYIEHAEVPLTLDTAVLMGEELAVVANRICESQGAVLDHGQWTYLTGV